MHVTGLCRGLLDADVDVTLVASLRRNPAFADTMDELTKAGVHCVTLDMRRGVSIPADTTALAQLKELFTKLEPDIVHGHSSKGGWLARAAAHQVGISKTVYTPHCFAFAGEGGPLRRIFYRRAERIAGKWTARLIAVSRWEGELAAKARIVPEERIICIPNGLGDAEFERVGRSQDLAAQLGLSPDERVIGFAGRLWPQKGADVLIQAFARVERERPGCRLLIIGDGPERQELEQLAQNCGIAGQVTFAGNRDNVSELMTVMDLFVLPSRWESAPYVVLEAMAAGVPVIASSVGGVGELLDDGRCGVLVEPDSPQPLADSIRTLLTDRERMAGMASAALDRVRKEYRMTRTVSMTADLYRELADQT